MIEPQNQIQKPKKISKAINYLIVSIIIGVINSIIRGATSETNIYSNGSNVFNLVFSFALMLFLIFKINSGKNWARIFFLVLLILYTLMLPFTIVGLFKENPIIGFLTLLITTIQIVSSTMIYSKESNEWIKSLENQSKTLQ